MTARPIYYPNKAYASGYHPGAFYYREDNDGPAHIVAWSPDAQQIAMAMWDLMENFPAQVDVEIKYPAENGIGDGDGWTSVAATLPLQRFLDTMGKHLTYLFESGGDILEIRNTKKPQTLTLDERGVLFFHGMTDEDSPKFEAAGFLPKRHPLIGEPDGCMLNVYNDADERRRAFLEALRAAAADEKTSELDTSASSRD